ncbi:granzyme B [Brachyhypopomus gauderio]|uniref:granzyme B n=1 Tax=Brachyhypopomus gauderio TaxID=698409 RepID=UPI0040439487
MNALHGLLFAVALSTLTCKDTHGGHIINGRKAQKNTLGFMASVQFNGKHHCGGFLIHPRYVLTAAHCDKSQMQGGQMTVVIGTENIKPTDNNLQKYAVENKYKYPTYKRVQDGGDIMLLKLSKSTMRNKALKTVKIPRADKPVRPNQKCQIAGWGKTEAQNIVDDLRVTDVPITDLKLCKEMWTKVDIKLPARVLCAGDNETKSGACQGDSGGPLVCNGVAVGIISFNLHNNCDYPNVPNVFTDISKYRVWIKKVIGK